MKRTNALEIIFLLAGVGIAGFCLAVGYLSDGPGFGGMGLIVGLALFLLGLSNLTSLSKAQHFQYYFAFWAVILAIFPFRLTLEGEIKFFSLTTLYSLLFAAGSLLLALKLRKGRKTNG